ncbi:hypothetical protein AGMMS50267_18430 [Spirochaetia bacterium]|nr:hypothetical protein AGMMS50267_18430 [Spirochaetia bacterium]
MVEYKSPEDTLSIYDFYKVMGYAYNYMSDPKRKAPITSITITLVASKHPRELLKYLPEVHKYQLIETASGIYQVSGDIIPIQIIVSPQLTETDNLWIKGLTHGLNMQSTDSIFKEARQKGNEPLIRAYLYVVLQANPQAAKEVVKMSDGALTLDDVLEEMGWPARWEKKGEEKEALKIAKNLLKKGWSVEDTAETAELNIETVKSLQASV